MSMSYNWSEGFKGALGGGATGLALGGPGGGLLGLGLGLLGGFGGGGGPKVNRDDYVLPGYDARTQRLQDFDVQNDERARALQQQGLLMALAGARGDRPSVAQGMLNQATQQNIRQQQGFMANQSQGNLNAANMALSQAANTQQQAANQASILRAQEMQANLGLFNQGQAQMRGQDIEQNTAKYQMELEALRQWLMNSQAQQQGLISYNSAVQGQAAQPTFGDQLMSGGAGLLTSVIAGRG